MQIIPLNLDRESKKFDLFSKILNNKNNVTFKNGDLLIISSKYLSISEGRIKKLSDVKPGLESIQMSQMYHIDPRLMELIIRESDEIFGGMYGFVLTSIHGVLAPNAGIDKSNIPYGNVVLYPKDPYCSLAILRLKFFVNLGIRVGIILTDSRILPMRKGTTGIALACCGFESLLDLKGTRDLFGNVLKYTSQNIADCFSSLGVLIMGESDRSTPVILIRDTNIKIDDSKVSSDILSIESKFDIYVRGLTVSNTCFKGLKCFNSLNYK